MAKREVGALGVGIDAGWSVTGWSVTGWSVTGWDILGIGKLVSGNIL